MSKKILRYIGTFAAVLCLFWALLILTSLIPNGQIKKNLQKSEEFYKSAEAFSFEQGQKMHTVSDNYDGKKYYGAYSDKMSVKVK